MRCIGIAVLSYSMHSEQLYTPSGLVREQLGRFTLRESRVLNTSDRRQPEKLRRFRYFLPLIVSSQKAAKSS